MMELKFIVFFLLSPKIYVTCKLVISTESFPLYFIKQSDGTWKGLEMDRVKALFTEPNLYCYLSKNPLEAEPVSFGAQWNRCISKYD
jgi:hypothetical protein